MTDINIRRCYKCNKEYDHTKLLSPECPVCKTFSLVMINPVNESYPERVAREMKERSLMIPSPPPQVFGPGTLKPDRVSISEMIELAKAQFVDTNKKYDQGKEMVALMKKDFSRALMAVAEVTTYGVKKYKQPGSWRNVENCYSRYEDALGRHDLAMMDDRFSKDEESGLLHAAHRAWNALATLETILTDLEKK